jgi:hypothetical protein
MLPVVRVKIVPPDVVSAHAIGVGTLSARNTGDKGVVPGVVDERLRRAADRNIPDDASASDRSLELRASPHLRKLPVILFYCHLYPKNAGLTL